MLKFDEVSHVNLASRIEVETIEVGSASALPPDYFETYRPGDARLDDDEKVFVFVGSWGARFFVVAKSADYTVTSRVP